MAAIKGLLFDKDGTLIDFQKTWIPINRDMTLEAARGDEALAKELLIAGGQDPVTNTFIPGALLGGAGVEAIAECFARVLNDRAPPNLTGLVARHFKEGGAKYAALIDGAVEAVKSLKARDYRIGIATNDTEDGLSASLGRHSGFLELFECHFCCDSGFGAKPEPGMGLAFAAQTGLAPGQCAIIGDTLHDLEMGQRAGFGLLVGVLTGATSGSDLARLAHKVLPSVLELEEAL